MNEVVLKFNTEIKDYCLKILGMKPKDYIFKNYILKYNDSNEDSASLSLSDGKPGLFAATSNLICMSASSVYKEQIQNVVQAYSLESSLFSRSKKRSWKFIGLVKLKPILMEDKKLLAYSANLARNLVKRLAKSMTDANSFRMEISAYSKEFYEK